MANRSRYATPEDHEYVDIFAGKEKPTKTKSVTKKANESKTASKESPPKRSPTYSRTVEKKTASSTSMRRDATWALRENVSCFYTSLLPDKYFKAYRVTCMVLGICSAVGTPIYIGATEGMTVLGVNFAMAGGWTLVFLLGDVILSVVVLFRPRPTQSAYELPDVIKLHWVVYYVSSTMNVMTAISYWILSYPRLPPEGASDALGKIHVHGLNLVYYLANIVIADTPFHFEHIWICCIFGVIYILFTGIYYAAGGRGLYHKRALYWVLDYEKKPASSAVVAIFMGLACPMAGHIFLSSLVYLKRRVMERRKAKDQVLNYTTTVGGIHYFSSKNARRR